MKNDKSLAKSQKKMRDAGVNPLAIDTFSENFRVLVSGKSTFIRENEIEPLQKIPKLSDVKIDEKSAHAALQKTAIIKLNGGLGTSMGLDKVKTALEVRNEKTFLDIIIQQILHARAKSGAKLPLIFMDSFRTSKDTLNFIREKYSDFENDNLPFDFIQDMEPKLRESDFSPIDWPKNRELEWCPPGHGDIYASLFSGGLLDELLAKNYEFLNVANGDNLGATPDANLAGWFAKSRAPFAMEVCRRTANDKKGGHLATRKSDKRTILRELAQTADEDVADFQNIEKHHFFNTNSLWLNLIELRKILREKNGILGLPLIKNVKNVDPTDAKSPKIIQMESAMGAAIEIFVGATAIEVPRARFMPVKTTNDLLILRSDLFKIDENFNLVATVKNLPRVNLDEKFYKNIADFDARFRVIPSLKNAKSFTISGDFHFEKPEKFAGEVELKK